MVPLISRALRRATAGAFGVALGAVALLWTVRIAHAQAGSVSGTVLDARSRRPLADALVRAETTNPAEQISARTSIRGEFRLAGLNSPSVRIRITRIGYQPSSQEVPVGGSPIQIELTELAVKLDEVVVTGTAGEQQRRTLGNDVGRVDVASTVIIAPPAKLQDLLSVNVPGVRVTRSSGAVGSGGFTRIRGAGSLSLSNEPLIYVDGIRVNSQANVRSDAFQDFSGESPSRINDFNPEEIESIEVLKGPAAATIYGTEASNGVIQIITKRGRAGRSTFDTHLDGGANWLMNPEGRYPSNYYIGRDGAVHEFRVLDFQKTICADPARHCPTDVFSMGTPVAMGASVSGGSDQLRHFLSLDFNRDEGIVDYNWQNRYSGRMNLSYSSAQNKFKVDASLGVVRSKVRSATATQPITTSIVWACSFPGCEPDPADPAHTGWNGPGHGFQFYRPEDYAHAFGYDQMDRTTFTLRLSHNPYSWLRHHLTIGPDFGNNRQSLLIERDGTGYQPFFDASNGVKTGSLLRSSYLTIDYGASADWRIGKNLLATTSAGAQYYYKQFDYIHADGRIFSIPGPSDITGASQRQGTESFIENKTFGVYGQEQVGWKNRLFLTGALRADGNSSFGANFNAVYYPKFSVSWVISEEPFLTNSKIFSPLKLRGAWGRAGQQPDVFSAIRAYQPRVGPQGQGGLTPKNAGNADLKPEVGQEIEVGFDAGLFNQRVGIQFTFYNKDVNDAILSLPLKPSRGFPGFQFVNIGKTRNKGFELGLDGTPINRPNLGLDLRFTFATNDSKILDLGGVLPSFVGGGEAFVQQWNVEGYAPSAFFYKKVVGSTVRRIPSGNIMLPLGFDVMCEGGADLSRGNGTVVPCANAPLLYAGRPTPSWSGSFNATLTLWKRLRLLGLVDFIGGNTTVVGDVAAVHTFFLSSKTVLEGSDPVLSGLLGLLYQGDFNAVGAAGLFKSGFAKLRTVSASYELPDRIARWVGAGRGSITLAAENLAFLWREQREAYGVSWVDPEIRPNRPFDTQGNYGYTQESWPQAARIRASIRLTF